MKNIIVLLVFLVNLNMLGQNIKNHQWENRVLVIFADVKSSALLKEQIEILSKNRHGLQERKLIIYQFSEGEFISGFNSVWKPSSLKIKKYFKPKEDFKVILIGLDGGIKFRQKEIVSTKKLFTLIDGMPIRRAELNKKN